MGISGEVPSGATTAPGEVEFDFGRFDVPFPSTQIIECVPDLENPDGPIDHRMLYPSLDWTNTLSRLALHGHSGLFIPVPKVVHDQLHDEVDFVPPLEDGIANVVNRDFLDFWSNYETYQDSIDGLLLSINFAVKQLLNPRAHSAKSALATAGAIEQQRDIMNSADRLILRQEIILR